MSFTDRQPRGTITGWRWNLVVDELECVTDQWRCDDKLQCIPTEFVCNGDNDCYDGSDEMACGILFLVILFIFSFLRYFISHIITFSYLH